MSPKPKGKKIDFVGRENKKLATSTRVEGEHTQKGVIYVPVVGPVNIKRYKAI